MPTTAHAAVTAVRHSIALLTYELGVIDPTTPLADLGERVHTLQRALARLEVLAAMHPDLTLDDGLPPGSMPADELAATLEQETELEQIVMFSPEPTTVTLAMRGIGAHMPQDVKDVAAMLHGVVVTVVPASGADDGAYVAEIGAVVADAVLTATTDEWALDEAELNRLTAEDAGEMEGAW
ncbi:hypothetical protein [Cellulomonas sp. ATA003]|uniref:hypothetical protein n=1 Tax=Cellulomonas sp. ATA003 TaxID=3073064 RepID=UPI002873864B|nr:hypothetical protein [Cellulomonas sp. ATA003]WNB86488.1 hypothetical protein REH70_04425 [Cellulomonas sp. ATA003]